MTGKFVVGGQPDMQAGKAMGGEHHFVRRAAQAFGSSFVALSASDHREYFSYIVASGKRYSHTAVFRGPQPYWVSNPGAANDSNQKDYMLVKDMGAKLPPPPPNAVASAHTHGAQTEGTSVNASATDHDGFRKYFELEKNSIRLHYVISANKVDVLFGQDRATMHEYRVGDDDKPGMYWDEAGKASKGSGPTIWERWTPTRALPRF